MKRYLYAKMAMQMFQLFLTCQSIKEGLWKACATMTESFSIHSLEQPLSIDISIALITIKKVCKL